jgi:hypothetical protein
MLILDEIQCGMGARDFSLHISMLIEADSKLRWPEDCKMAADGAQLFRLK